LATQVFAEKELERLRGFPEIGRVELSRFFTLALADAAFADPGRGRGLADRLGLSVATPDQWSSHRAQFCQLVGKPADPARALTAAAEELADALGELEQVLVTGEGPVRLDEDGDLVISPLTLEDVPTEAVALKGELTEIDLITPTGKRKGANPSTVSIYRALAEHAKRERHPDGVHQAYADFAVLQVGR